MRRASTRSIRRAASTPPSPDATKKLAVAPLVSPTGNPRSPAKSKDHYTRHSEGTGLAAPRSASPLTSGGVGTTGPRNGPFFGWRGIGFRRGDRRFDRRGMQHCAANLPLQEKRKLARAGLGEFKPDGGAQEARLSIHVGSVHTEIPVVIKESIPNIDIPDPALLRVLAEDIVAGGSGSRWRARMLRITSAEWTPCAIASAAAPDARSGRPGHPKRERLVAPHALRAEPEWLDRPSAMGAADARP